jgi:hypothetical protein
MLYSCSCRPAAADWTHCLWPLASSVSFVLHQPCQKRTSPVLCCLALGRPLPVLLQALGGPTIAVTIIGEWLHTGHKRSQLQTQAQRQTHIAPSVEGPL